MYKTLAPLRPLHILTVSCKLMNQLQFNIHQNFYLHTDGWGQAQFQEITKLLDSVITDFHANLDLGQITGKSVYAINVKN